MACDEQGGGRLIFYDFGMMDEFKPNVRSGLVNLIFSTYENDPRAVCDALVEMGILKAGADRIRWACFCRAHRCRDGLSRIGNTGCVLCLFRLLFVWFCANRLECSGHPWFPDRTT